MERMPRPRPPFLHPQVTRHGNVVWYFRRGHGGRIRISGQFGTPEFDAQYQAALTGQKPLAPKDRSARYWNAGLAHRTL
jgi:hypothetical protein